MFMFQNQLQPKSKRPSGKQWTTSSNTSTSQRKRLVCVLIRSVWILLFDNEWHNFIISLITAVLSVDLHIPKQCGYAVTVNYVLSVKWCFVVCLMVVVLPLQRKHVVQMVSGHFYPAHFKCPLTEQWWRDNTSREMERCM